MTSIRTCSKDIVIQQFKNFNVYFKRIGLTIGNPIINTIGSIILVIVLFFINYYK